MCFIVNTQLRVDVRCEVGELDYEGENGLFTIFLHGIFQIRIARSRAEREKRSGCRENLLLSQQCDAMPRRSFTESPNFGFPALTTVSSMRKKYASGVYDFTTTWAPRYENWERVDDSFRKNLPSCHGDADSLSRLNLNIESMRRISRFAGAQ